MSELLPAIEIETAPNPVCAVIWMHGLGADGSDFAPVVPELRLPASPGKSGTPSTAGGSQTKFGIYQTRSAGTPNLCRAHSASG